MVVFFAVDFFAVVFLAGAFFAMALYLLSCDKNVEASKYSVNVFFRLYPLFSRKIAGRGAAKDAKDAKGEESSGGSQTQFVRSSDSLSLIFPGVFGVLGGALPV